MMFVKVRQIIAEQLSVEEDGISMDTSLKEDLGADSLEMFEVVMALEEGFEVEIPTEDLTDVNTVEDIVNYLKNKGIEE